MIILTEGSNEIGLGHIYRCLAVREEAESRKISVKMIVAETNSLRLFEKDSLVSYIDWKRPELLAHLLNENKPDIILVDSYLADREIYRQLGETNAKLLIIDDVNNFRYTKGTIINPAFNARDTDYPYNNSEFDFWLGSNYTILRKSFRRDHNRKIDNEIKRIFIMIGGSDVLNLSSEVVRMALVFFEHAQIVLVNASVEDERVECLSDLSEKQIYAEMIKADIAIVAAGQTVFEMIATRLPFITIKVAENQSNNIEMLKSRSLGLQVEDLRELPNAMEQLNKIEIRQQQVSIFSRYQLNGTQRIIDQALVEGITIREAELTDINSTYELSISNEVRKWSLSSAKFSFESHQSWYNKVLSSSESLLLILEKKTTKEFLGQIRFDKLEKDCGLISLSFTEGLRGGKISHLLVEEAMELAVEKLNLNSITAEVKTTNIPSIRLFEKSHFSVSDVKDDVISFIYTEGKE